MIGKIIGNYQITSELAQGGMGAVYRGRHLHLPREVVVKSILLGAFSPSAQDHLKARFRREAFVQSQLDHPNIVRVYEFFAAEENYYLVMEYVAGMSLRDLLARQGPPTPAQAVYLLKQALEALDYAHDFRSEEDSEYRHTGVIHRDIKPANMLLDAKGRLKITDFGIVKMMGEQTELAMTQSGFHPGTVEYMSPEQLLGTTIDARSDLYSLGVTFYETLTGRLPFRRSATGSDWEIRKGHIELDPPPILEIRPEIHPQLAAIIMRSLRKNPADRYQTAAQFLEAALDYEQNYAGKGQTIHSPSVKPTQPQSAPFTLPGQKSTVMDESATLLARPAQVESSSGRKAHLEDDLTLPLVQSAFSQATTPPDPAGVKIAPPSSAGQSGRKWPLALGGVGLLLAGTAVGAILFSRQRAPERPQSNEATKVATPAPTSSPTPAPVQTQAVRATPKPKPPVTPALAEKTNFKLAQSLEQQERYDEAVKIYEDYFARNATAPDAPIVASYLNELRKVQLALNLGDSMMNSRLYPMAKKHYMRALALRPDSRRAKEGLDAVEEKMKSIPPPGSRRGFSLDKPIPIPSGPNPSGPNPSGIKRDFPSDQPFPPRMKRKTARPTPTPRDQEP